MFYKAIAAIIGFLLSFQNNLGVSTDILLPSPTPAEIDTVLPTPTEQLSPTLKISTPTATKIITPTLIPTPTINQTLVDECNKAWMPVIEFSGHACLAADNEMRWIDSKNGHPMSESELDNTMKDRREGEIRKKLLSQCLKATKERFETCNTSIRDNATRIREIISKQLESEVNHCKNTATMANDTMKQFTARYMAKDRMMGKIEALYNFCYSHGDSVTTYQP